VTLGITVRPARLVLVLLAVTLVLTLLSLIVNVMWVKQWRGAETAVELFSVDREGSIPTWWSALMLVATGGLTWLVSRSRRHTGWKERLAWWTLIAGFVFLSIDESCMLHERIGRKVQLKGSLHHARWILLWLPPALLVAGVILWQLWRVSSRFVLGITVGVLVFLSGAVGVETLNAKYRYEAETLARQEAMPVDATTTAPPLRDWRKGPSFYPYLYGMALEEFLEMLGPVIWFAVLLALYREETQAAEPPQPGSLG
jgi:hypothetical protein